jgi:hypothetical protein
MIVTEMVVSEQVARDQKTGVTDGEKGSIGT